MKKNLLKYSILLILPVLLVIISFVLSYARGPFWLSTNSDPDYAYLIYFLDLIKNGKTLGIQHPGTTLQMLGVVLVKIKYFFRDVPDDIETDVLKNPEVYLYAVNKFLVILNGVILLFTGIMIYMITKNIGISLLFQFSPFISMRNLMITAQVSPEQLIIFTTLLFSLLIILISSAEKENKFKKYIILLAIISGFGLATKLLFLPYLIIPLFIIKNFRIVILYLSIIIVSFIIFTIPVVSQYKDMLLWLYKILTHKKLYGYGDYEIINWHSYLLSIKKIFFTNITFSLILFVSICFLFINKASKRLNDISKKQKSLKLLLGVVISQVIAILMIAKHFSGNHYMAINCCLSGLTLVLMVLYLMQINHVFRLNVRNIINYFLFLVIGVIVFRIILIFEINKSFKNIKDESTYIHNRVMTQYPGYDKIYYYRSSSPQFALFFGSVYSNSLFADTLRKIYGAINYYDKLGKEYYTWDKKISMDSLKKKSNNKIIFQGKPLKPEEMPANLKLKAVYKGNWETIYVVE